MDYRLRTEPDWDEAERLANAATNRAWLKHSGDEDGHYFKVTSPDPDAGGFLATVAVGEFRGRQGLLGVLWAPTALRWERQKHFQEGWYLIFWETGTGLSLIEEREDGVLPTTLKASLRTTFLAILPALTRPASSDEGR